MRILHLPSSIGGNAYNLSLGEKKNGVSSTVVIIDPTMYSYKTDYILSFPKNKLLLLISWLSFCLKNAGKYDVFHYNFGSPLFNTHNKTFFGLDMRLFRLMGKVTAVTFQGSDCRQKRYCVDHYEITCYTEQDAIKEQNQDLYKQFRVGFYDQHVDLIYATNPDLLNMLPSRAKFRPYTKLQPEEWTPCYSDYTKKKTVILHAPSNQKVKGTAYVDEAIKRLEEEGYEIEYRLLQGIPNDEVIEYYKGADLVIDQLMIGWYGGFAVECMALGKPVMCYIRESDMKYIPEEMNRDMPIIRVTPYNLYGQLKRTLDEKEKLSSLARQSRTYVEKWHNPQKIAAMLIADYQQVLNQKR